MRSHISFSELKIWNDCPYKHKLVYIDEVNKFKGNEHTAFGTAMHYVCENMVEGKKINAEKLFSEKFLDELKSLKKNNVEINKKLVQDMRGQAQNIFSHILPGLKKKFGKFKVISVEEALYEPLQDIFFKGYIDLVIQTEDNKYHVIDWKTCSWGWDSRRKADRITSYQITLYKNFFAKKHNLNADNIETYFALLKRTAKSNNVEIFRVTSGRKKIENSLKLLDKAVYNIKNENFIKNKLSCTSGYGCEFYKTKYCR